MLFAFAVSSLVILYSTVLATLLARLEKPSAQAPSALQALTHERAYQAHRLLDRHAASKKDVRKAA
jgi:hypothetical protein